ncbi:MAG: hypothetical protein QM755_09235 [Luteolibacter sp.]
MPADHQTIVAEYPPHLIRAALRDLRRLRRQKGIPFPERIWRRERLEALTAELKSRGLALA